MSHWWLALVQLLIPLQWRHNGCDFVWNHQPRDCLLNRFFRLRSKKTSKLRVTGLCTGSSPGTGEFPIQMASYAENVSIWWRHHALYGLCSMESRIRTLVFTSNTTRNETKRGQDFFGGDSCQYYIALRSNSQYLDLATKRLILKRHCEFLALPNPSALA